MNICL